MGNILYTADLHFGHAGVIRMDGRPFENVNVMDKELINNWNYRVNRDTKIYLDRDFVFKSEHEPQWYLERLNGKKYLIIGNHDSIITKNSRAMSYFEEIDKMMHVNDKGRQICLCHYPLAEWNGYFRGAYHVYAHIHNNKNRAYEFMKNEPKALNAGCMINGYMTVTLDELIVNNNRFKNNN